ncbi:MAG TPA: aldo/keto reductase [Bryobacteraceae bacterium]|nr:aldo/keto reductase [Bryobacteraceae bacterium]
MEKRKIGSLTVSLAGLGCNNFGWRIDADGTAAVVSAAIEAGINFFDTADIYGGGQSEEYLGRALKGRRDKVLIATKFGMKMADGKEGAQPAYIRQAAEDSLRRLGTDHIDLYQIHKPDTSTPIADTLGALDQLVKAGKVREIGCSNFSAAQLREASEVQGVAHFVSVQNNYSLFHREPEAEVLPECHHLGMAFLPYFPLANGLLTGKYRQGQPFPKASRAEDGFGPKVFTEENLALAEQLRGFAESRGHTLLELAMAWLASKRMIASVIAGAKTPEQVKANAAAVAWRLTDADLAAVNSILEPVRQNG